MDVHIDGHEQFGGFKGQDRAGFDEPASAKADASAYKQSHRLGETESGERMLGAFSGWSIGV